VFDAPVRKGSCPAECRPLLLSFKGRRTHPLRRVLFGLHNGRDRICIDSTEQRAEARRRYGPDMRDDESIALHSQSRFSLCPRGDAVYSFRVAEALSCGAIPVIYGDGWVLPFSELLDYRTFTVCIPEAEARDWNCRAIGSISAPDSLLFQFHLITSSSNCT